MLLEIKCIDDINSISIYVDNKIINLELICTINEKINNKFILEDGIKLYTNNEKKEEAITIQKNSENQESFVVMVNKEEVRLTGNSSYIYL